MLAFSRFSIKVLFLSKSISASIISSSIDFLEDPDNWETASGLHLQGGLRFKVLMLDTHLNARYNLAKDIYTGKSGWLQLMFKLGFAI